MKRLLRNADLLLLGTVIFILVLMVLPMPAWLLDLLLTFNIAFSLAILLVAMYARKALEFSVFPSVLLIVTLARLSLNVASTRLILLDGYAGQVIQTFGNFVVGGNTLVGLVIFIILVVIQFVVITNGAGRVAEVAARFTLDAMPGKQMSIDADLAAGVISQEAAQARRQEVEREADFYGAMDGAGKFVKGDAIAAVVIMAINIVGGLGVGVTQKGLPLLEALHKYTLLTIGEGLVGQISALLVSTATGLIVTRAASESHLGEDLTRQFVLQPLALKRIVWLLLGFSLVPGMPKIPFWLMAGVLYGISRSGPLEEESTEPSAVVTGSAPAGPEDTIPLLDLEPIELELGYAMVDLVDQSNPANLLHRIVGVRRSCATELGIVVPPIRIRDNLQLRPGQYRVRLYGQTIGEGEIYPRRFLAMSPVDGPSDLDGIPVREPAFGLPAVWIPESQREAVELKGYTVVDPASVVATHVSEVLRNCAAEILGRQEVQQLLDHLRERYPKLVDDVVPARVSLTQLRKVMQNLLQERVSVRDLRGILETLADHATTDSDPAWLTEKVREAMSRSILSEHVRSDKTLPVVALSPAVEACLEEALPGGPGMDPQRVRDVVARTARAVGAMANRGLSPIVVCSQR
ncbi:MAG: flagellar biosynthesis protein FlhA, partial [Candidatus Eremiobacterota bacterium]